jgi:hypothetical protein
MFPICYSLHQTDSNRSATRTPEQIPKATTALWCRTAKFLAQDELVEDVRQDELRRSASDLLLVERAREWLLGEGD